MITSLGYFFTPKFFNWPKKTNIHKTYQEGYVHLFHLLSNEILDGCFRSLAVISRSGSCVSKHPNYPNNNPSDPSNVWTHCVKYTSKLVEPAAQCQKFPPKTFVKTTLHQLDDSHCFENNIFVIVSFLLNSGARYIMVTIQYLNKKQYESIGAYLDKLITYSFKPYWEAFHLAKYSPKTEERNFLESSFGILMLAKNHWIVLFNFNWT